MELIDGLPPRSRLHAADIQEYLRATCTGRHGIGIFQKLLSLKTVTKIFGEKNHDYDMGPKMDLGKLDGN
jgi:hypothetical protein